VQNPDPILVADRFPALLDALLNLLEPLSAEEWSRPTVASGWTVKDIALHLLGDDVGLLSGKRDHFTDGSAPAAPADLVRWINQRNGQWVQAARRMSPRLLCDLLRSTGEQVNAFLPTLDMFATGMAVTWAGTDPAPVWLDVAREFTERWHHQQHIRDALGRPGCTEAQYLAPVLATFVHALPVTYQSNEAPPGVTVSVTITGEAGGIWTVKREEARWSLWSGKPEQPDAEVIMPEETAWRLFTKGISKKQAGIRTWLAGDVDLAEQALNTLSILA
jgi:uncharacterized protein (TIGR03083 family)